MASLLDLLAPYLRQTQTPDRVVSAQPQGGANMAVDPSMARGMPQQSAYAQQLQDPNQWNPGGSPQVPDYSRITTPGNPAGPSYNANYGQTSYPGSTAGVNPQSSLLPPGNRGLLMASGVGGGQGPSATQLNDFIGMLQQLNRRQSESISKGV